MLDKIRKYTEGLFFVIFVLLNCSFCVLYCGEISILSWGFSVFWSLILVGILVILPTWIRRIGMVLFTIIEGLICILHATMFNLFGHFFSFSDIMYSEDGAAFFSFSYINVRKLLWITISICVLLSVFMAWNLKKTNIQ